MARNPYAAPRAAERNGTAPPHMNVWGGHARYAVPDVPETTDPDYTDGYSPQLKSGGSSDGSALPDDIRIGKREQPIPGHNWNDPRWQAKRDSEFLKRHSVEHWEKDWHVKQQKAPTPNHPLWTQERMPIRPTADLAPMPTTFQRPWHIPRNIKDALGENAQTHFSLADHRRMKPIADPKTYGMRPAGRLGVNTYRERPRPWDENLFIPPPAANHHLNMGISPSNRAFRL
jgi:hypothetical protein